jgi:hypothetical protein
MPTAESPPSPPADAAVSAEGVRETLPPPASPAALLQCGMRGGRPCLAALEGPATIPGYGSGPAEAERAKPALPGAPPESETARAQGSCGSREGHPYKIFFRVPVTARAATWSLIGVGDHPCNGSARWSAGGLGSASGSGSNAGERRGQGHRGRKCFPRVRAGWRWARARGRSGDRLEILTRFPAFD